MVSPFANSVCAISGGMEVALPMPTRSSSTPAAIAVHSSRSPPGKRRNQRFARHNSTPPPHGDPRPPAAANRPACARQWPPPSRAPSPDRRLVIPSPPPVMRTDARSIRFERTNPVPSRWSGSGTSDLAKREPPAAAMDRPRWSSPTAKESRRPARGPSTPACGSAPNRQQNNDRDHRDANGDGCHLKAEPANQRDPERGEDDAPDACAVICGG